jgi:hypothetical protein
MVPHWYPLCSLLTVLSIGLKHFSKQVRQRAKDTMGNPGWRWLSGPVTDIRMVTIKKSELHVVRQHLTSRACSRDFCVFHS